MGCSAIQEEVECHEHMWEWRCNSTFLGLSTRCRPVVTHQMKMLRDFSSKVGREGTILSNRRTGTRVCTILVMIMELGFWVTFHPIFVTFRNQIFFPLSCCPHVQPPQPGGAPLVGSPRLLIQYIRSYPPYLEAVSSIRNLRACHVVMTRDPFYSSFGGKAGTKGKPEKHRCRWEYDIKMGLVELV
jgi:hypothetical protein